MNIKYRGGEVPASVLEDLRARRGEEGEGGELFALSSGLLMKSDRVRRSPSPLLSFFFSFLLFLTFCHTPTEGYVSMLFAPYFIGYVWPNVTEPAQLYLELLRRCRARRAMAERGSCAVLALSFSAPL